MKKKVLVFMLEFPVITETFIARELSALVESDSLDVAVFTRRISKGKIPENLKDHLYSPLGTTVGGLFGFPLRKLIGNWPTFIFLQPKRCWEVLKTIGVFRIGLFIKILGYAAIFKYFFKPDIIYAHFLSIPSTIALGASILLDIPLVISGHARDVLEYPDILEEKVKRAKFITICNKNAFEKLEGENVKLIYHGIDPSELQIQENVEKLSPSMILCVARYVDKKGLEYLIEAASTLKTAGLNFTINMVGDGPLRKDLEKRINELKLEDQVSLLGEQPFDEVKKLMHQASVYVQPSIDSSSGDSDGVPNSLIEAAMLNIPIVATDAGSILDFLSEENALLVSQRNPEELANAITKLLNDKALATNLSTKARDKALEMFDLRQSIRKISELFN